MFTNLEEKEMLEIDEGSILGFLAAAALFTGAAAGTAGAVVLVGKGAQKLSDWIG